MGERRKRKRWNAEDKLRIVFSGMEPGVEIPELSRREGINPTQFYTQVRRMLLALGLLATTRDKLR